MTLFAVANILRSTRFSPELTRKGEGLVVTLRQFSRSWVSECDGLQNRNLPLGRST